MRGLCVNDENELPYLLTIRRVVAKRSPSLPFYPINRYRAIHLVCVCKHVCITVHAVTHGNCAWVYHPSVEIKSLLHTSVWIGSLYILNSQEVIYAADNAHITMHVAKMMHGQYCRSGSGTLAAPGSENVHRMKIIAFVWITYVYSQVTDC